MEKEINTSGKMTWGIYLEIYTILYCDFYNINSYNIFYAR